MVDIKNSKTNMVPEKQEFQKNLIRVLLKISNIIMEFGTIYALVSKPLSFKPYLGWGGPY